MSERILSVTGWSTHHNQLDKNPDIDSWAKGATEKATGYVVYRFLKDGSKEYLRPELTDTFSLRECRELLERAELLTGNTYSKIVVSDYEHEDGRTLRDKSYHYNKKTNCLTIWDKGLPVYENCNGQICKDRDALADCLM